MANDYLDELVRRDRQAVPQARGRYEPDRLIGLTEAEARALIDAAGGTFEAHDPDEPLTMDLRLDRVRAEIVDGRVVTALIG